PSPSPAIPPLEESSSSGAQVSVFSHGRGPQAEESAMANKREAPKSRPPSRMSLFRDLSVSMLRAFGLKKGALRVISRKCAGINGSLNSPVDAPTPGTKKRADPRDPPASMTAL